MLNANLQNLHVNLQQCTIPVENTDMNFIMYGSPPEMGGPRQSLSSMAHGMNDSPDTYKAFAMQPNARSSVIDSVTALRNPDATGSSTVDVVTAVDHVSRGISKT